MKIVSTIEARMTSSRLPGKVLMEVDGKPMLYYLVKRLKQIPRIDEIVLATTTNETDDVLVDFAKNVGISFFRGSEDDVMGRVLRAGQSIDADVIVEICGDCPLIDPQIIGQTISMFLANDVDYACNNFEKTYPMGMDTQVFKLSALEKSAKMTDHPLDREHVTRHIRNHPEIFKHVYLVAPEEINFPDLEVTLDEPSDFEFIKNIIQKFRVDGKENFSCLEMVNYIKMNPSLLNINQEVKRKGYNK